MSIDLFAAEDAIIARLRAVLAATVTVGSAAAVAGRTDITDLLPAAFVAAGAASRSDSGDDGALIVETQTWNVVLCAAINRDVVTQSAQYSAALGALGAQVISALSGWQPGESFKPLINTGREAPQIQPGGWIELPIAFETVAIQGA